MRLLLQEKDQRIEDLRRDKETLSIFAHYFKSLEYRRLEESSEAVVPDSRSLLRVQLGQPGQLQQEALRRK
ncbi:MAG: hypothetical protein PHG79_09710 [Methanosarcina sp.]|nr:hypothetical protein [Methanosarcina sp.]MDD3874377.1 hypothetical protein [Methanosarcina sp.]MDD4522868.1 hypothetical protein [Methanosarcina sp.]